MPISCTWCKWWKRNTLENLVHQNLCFEGYIVLLKNFMAELKQKVTFLHEWNVFWWVSRRKYNDSHQDKPKYVDYLYTKTVGVVCLFSFDFEALNLLLCSQSRGNNMFGQILKLRTSSQTNKVWQNLMKSNNLIEFLHINVYHRIIWETTTISCMLSIKILIWSYFESTISIIHKQQKLWCCSIHWDNFLVTGHQIWWCILIYGIFIKLLDSTKFCIALFLWFFVSRNSPLPSFLDVKKIS